jgi:hypothetical protein
MKPAMQGTVPMSEEAFRKLALSDPSGGWELKCGVPRQKPAMTFEHNWRDDRSGRAVRLNPVTAPRFV